MNFNYNMEENTDSQPVFATQEMDYSGPAEELFNRAAATPEGITYKYTEDEMLSDTKSGSDYDVESSNNYQFNWPKGSVPMHFTIAQINQITNALGDKPAKEVFHTIAAIQHQVIQLQNAKIIPTEK